MSDFRSDTLTQPTPAMREAMARAEVGDDVFGEDPTVRRLEQVAADFLGVAAALYVPSGTMANQVAVHVHCRPGDELICDERCHLFLAEGGGVARWSGTQIRPLRTSRGFPEVEQLAAAVRALDDHHPRSRLLALENTHNMAGGTVLGPERTAELVDEAHRLGLLVHLDGARLVNAAVAAGCAPAALTHGVDSVSMCLSKGLGAPVGSLVGGTAEFVAAARRARKALGGGMRQAGVLAAAGLIALQDGPGLVADDHRRARDLAQRLQRLPGLEVGAVESNIVLVHPVGRPAGELVRDLERRGVRALAFGRRTVRFVTHRDLEDADVERCAAAVAEALRETAAETD